MQLRARWAAQLDSYVNCKQKAARQQAGEHSWLVIQHQLTQEVADCSAGLTDAVRTNACLLELLLALEGNGEGDDQLPQFAQTEGLVSGAVSLSMVISDLLEAARSRRVPLGAGAVTEIQGHVEAMRQGLSGAGQELASLATSLYKEARSQAASVRKRCGEGNSGDSLRERVQDLCAQHPLVEDDVKQQLHEAAAQREAVYFQRRKQSAMAYAAFLQRQHQSAQVAGLAAPQDCEFEEIAAAALDDLLGGSQEGSDGASGVVVAPSEAFGWTEEEQAAFIRIRQDCLREAGASASQAAVIARIQLRLPQKTDAQLRGFYAWHKEATRLRNDLLQVQRGWESDVQSFLAAAMALLAESANETLEQAGAAAERLAFEAALLQRTKVVNQLQAEREAKKTQELKQQVAKQVEEEEQRRGREADHERYRARLHTLLAQHRDAQTAKQQAELAQKEAREVQEQEKAAAKVVVNKERVQLRRQLATDRANAAARAREAQEMEDQRREAALERLRAQVAPAVECDPQRVVAPTESSRAAGGPRRAGGEAAFRAICGFTTDDVLKDQRFKLFEALRRLNLHTFEYAREVVAQARPAKVPRPETLTTLQQLGLA
ncbi:hypothetical protein N2152v2_008783 [Parachlorella kessleri]